MITRPARSVSGSSSSSSSSCGSNAYNSDSSFSFSDCSFEFNKSEDPLVGNSCPQAETLPGMSRPKIKKRKKKLEKSRKEKIKHLEQESSHHKENFVLSSSPPTLDYSHIPQTSENDDSNQEKTNIEDLYSQIRNHFPSNEDKVIEDERLYLGLSEIIECNEINPLCTENDNFDLVDKSQEIHITISALYVNAKTHIISLCIHL